MKWQQSFPSTYLRGEQLDREVDATIATVGLEEVTNASGDKDDKLVVTFTEPVYPNGPKKLILNKTRGAALARVADSDDTDCWEGATITLAPDTWNGKPTVKIKG